MPHGSPERRPTTKSAWTRLVNLSVYVPEYQRRQIAKNKRFDLLEPYKAARVYREHIAETGDKTVMLFRPAMMRDIDDANLWRGARAIWSQWDGYLKEGAGAKLQERSQRSECDAREYPHFRDMPASPT